MDVAVRVTTSVDLKKDEVCVSPFTERFKATLCDWSFLVQIFRGFSSCDDDEKDGRCEN
jgi:hypothetical protein